MKTQKIYGDISFFEQGALDQFDSAMKLDCVVQGALMPDAHQGYSLPIGGVVATDSMIFPSWVGFDIGCGMCAAKFDGLKKEHLDLGDTRREITRDIYRMIPVGFNHHRQDQEYSDFDPMSIYFASSVAKDLWKDTDPLKQIGTLGGGNHFIEIGYDENEDVWAIVHSGSRGYGWKIAQSWMKIASGDGKAREGHFGFDVHSPRGREYISDLKIGLDFARANRRHMLKAVSNIVECEYDMDTFINRNHNHAEFAHDMWIHRKGATHAEAGMMGVIPGNMRDGSFIVKGKGAPDSLWSSSHGAGRVLGRKKAKELLSLDEFKSQMVGVTAKVEQNTLDESPMAYKNIFDVMEYQRDLVEIVHHIKPLINIKG